MKPMGTKEGEIGLLEYLEDIIGSNQYVQRIQDIEVDLSQRNDERIDKINRVKAA
jgi:structural maintenance of chromosome 4